MGRTFTHLTLKQRMQIKEMLDAGYRKTDIAKALGIHNATIYREIERGSINGKYNPNFSEETYRRQLLGKGSKPILSLDPELAEYIAQLILIEKLSPAQIVDVLRSSKRFEKYPKSRNTIYNAIDDGLIPGVTRNDLHSDTTTVFGGGNIHVAKWVRDILDIKDGDELNFEIIDGKLVFSKGSCEMI